MLAFAMFLSSYPFRVGLRLTADEARVSLALVTARTQGVSRIPRGSSSPLESAKKKVLHVPVFPPQSLTLVDDVSLVSMDDSTRTRLADVAAHVRNPLFSRDLHCSSVGPVGPILFCPLPFYADR
jgi:hypothetical protein